MYAIPQLRTAIHETVESKANARAAGAGLWAWYVRASMYENAPIDAEGFEKRAADVKAELDAIKPLSKAERNSFGSAKSVIKSAVENGIDVWKRDADGIISKDEAGHPIPRGKSDLQNDKSPMEKLLKILGSAEQLVQADDWPTLNEVERTEVLAKVKSILASCGVVF